MRAPLPLLGAALLSACTVGPRYRTPEVAPAAPGGFAEASAATSAAPPPGRWWRLYDDPALDVLVQRALVRNTDLRQAAANLEEARSVLDQTLAGRLPSTTVGAGASRNRNAAAAAQAAGAGSGATGTAARPPQPFNLFQGSLAASYEVDLFGRVRRAVDAARADTEALAAAQDLVRTAVAADTTQAYVLACTSAQQADVARRSQALVDESYGILVRQRDLGAASDYDVANVRTLLEQARALVPPLEAQRRSALYALAVLTGDPPERVDTAGAACRSPPRATTALPVGDGAGLLARRPDVRGAERRLAAAAYRINVATADLYPTITLGASVNTIAVDPGDLFGSNNVGYRLGPLLSWSFPNTLAARGRIRQAEARAQAALANFDGVVLGALRDLEQALATYGSELDRRAALQAARDAAAEAFRLANVRATGGAISFLDSITVQRNLVAADTALAQSDAALAANRIAVFRALGGGWEGAPAIETRPLPQKTKGG